MFRVIFANMAEEMTGDEGLTLLVAFIIALATVSSQAIKAAIANPVKSLRTE